MTRFFTLVLVLVGLTMASLTTVSADSTTALSFTTEDLPVLVKVLPYESGESGYFLNVQLDLLKPRSGGEVEVKVYLPDGRVFDSGATFFGPVNTTLNYILNKPERRLTKDVSVAVEVEVVQNGVRKSGWTTAQILWLTKDYRNSHSWSPSYKIDFDFYTRNRWVAVTQVVLNQGTYNVPTNAPTTKSAVAKSEPLPSLPVWYPLSWPFAIAGDPLDNSGNVGPVTFTYYPPNSIDRSWEYGLGRLKTPFDLAQYEIYRAAMSSSNYVTLKLEEGSGYFVFVKRSLSTTSPTPVTAKLIEVGGLVRSLYDNQVMRGVEVVFHPLKSWKTGCEVDYTVTTAKTTTDEKGRWKVSIPPGLYFYQYTYKTAGDMWNPPEVSASSCQILEKSFTDYPMYLAYHHLPYVGVVVDKGRVTKGDELWVDLVVRTVDKNDLNAGEVTFLLERVAINLLTEPVGLEVLETVWTNGYLNIGGWNAEKSRFESAFANTNGKFVDGSLVVRFRIKVKEEAKTGKVKLILLRARLTDGYDQYSSYSIAPEIEVVERMEGDFDGDGTVTIIDFSKLASKFGRPCTCLEDMNRDKVVTILDFSLFVRAWNAAHQVRN